MVTGGLPDTDMVTTTGIIMGTITDIVQDIVRDIMLEAGMRITDPHPIITGHKPPTICITTVHRV
jgi:hypothetical protein